MGGGRRTPAATATSPVALCAKEDEGGEGEKRKGWSEERAEGREGGKASGALGGGGGSAATKSATRMGVRGGGLRCVPRTPPVARARARGAVASYSLN